MRWPASSNNSNNKIKIGSLCSSTFTFGHLVEQGSSRVGRLLRIPDLFIWGLVIYLCISFKTLFYFNNMFLFIMFLVCSSYILDIVLFDDLHLHMFVESLIQFARELGSFDYVSVVLRYEILVSLYFLSLEYHYHATFIYHLFIFYLTYPC
jgi:hypothetical protein